MSLVIHKTHQNVSIYIQILMETFSLVSRIIGYSNCHNFNLSLSLLLLTCPYTIRTLSMPAKPRKSKRKRSPSPVERHPNENPSGIKLEELNSITPSALLAKCEDSGDTEMI